MILGIIYQLSGTRTEIVTCNCVRKTVEECTRWCNEQINAVGDRVSYDITDLGAYDWGKIERKTKIDISFPAGGKRILYTFTPTKNAPLADKTLEVLFIAYSLDEPLPLDVPYNLPGEAAAAKRSSPNAHMLVKILRRVQDVEIQWTEMASLVSEETDPQQWKAAKVEIDTNGDVLIYKTCPDELTLGIGFGQFA